MRSLDKVKSTENLFTPKDTIEEGVARMSNRGQGFPFSFHFLPGQTKRFFGFLAVCVLSDKTATDIDFSLVFLPKTLKNRRAKNIVIIIIIRHQAAQRFLPLVRGFHFFRIFRGRRLKFLSFLFFSFLRASHLTPQKKGN